MRQKRFEGNIMENDKSMPAEVIGSVRWLVEAIQSEVWELDSQGRLTEDNITLIMGFLAQAHHAARSAKWAGVEHLKEGAA